MQLDLSDDQQMVQETTRRFLETEFPLTRVRALAENDTGIDRDAIAGGAELGWFSFLVAEADGGGSISGEPVSDAAIIAEEAGRAVFCGPVIPTNVVADAISRTGSAAQKAAHLDAIIAGQRLATWAFAEENDRWDGAGVGVVAQPDGDGVVVTGTKSFVQDAGAADLMMVTARTGDGLTQLLVPAGTPGVTITPLTALDLGRRFSDVTFEGVHLGADRVLGPIGGADDVVARQADLATALVCAETIGSLDACFAMTLEYMHSRKAFGRPIGSFQALKHRLADMALWLETGKAVAVAAAHAVDHDVERAEAVSVAKSYIGDRGPAIVRDCLQLHGGIGYTWEFDLHLYLRGWNPMRRCTAAPPSTKTASPASSASDRRTAEETTMSAEDLDTADVREFRLRARAWLADIMTPLQKGPDGDVLQRDDSEPDEDRIAWARAKQAVLFDNGYAGLTFPTEYGGGGLSLDHERAFLEEAAGYEMPTQVFAVSLNILGKTLEKYGTDEQKARHLPRMLRGEEIWLQLLSEPSGGSDLAGLITRAVRDGDSFIVNGQKIWSTGAQHSDFAMCPARTNWDVPKHKGISMLIVDLRSPGIEIRPIEQINGGAEFCEEFLTDVVVPAENLIGDENEGWAVARGLLDIEHEWVGRSGGGTPRPADVSALVALAKRRGLGDDSGVRRRIAEVHALERAQALVAKRVSNGIAEGSSPTATGPC